MLELTSDQVDNAETVGVFFPAATPQQVQRYAMQRKVFRIGGEPVLATRDGARFETSATLGRLIAEGERQRRDLAGWEASAAPPAEAPAPPSPPRGRKPSAPRPEPMAQIAPRTAVAAKPPRPETPRGERWLTAGAVRRGRLAQHWSRRRA